jgi:hypothetical protein
VDRNSVASSPQAAAAARIDPEPGPVYIRPELISGCNIPKSMAKFLTRRPVTTPTVIASGTSAEELSRSHAAPCPATRRRDFACCAAIMPTSYSSIMQ